MQPPVIEKVDSAAGRFWWRIRAVNGEILSDSEQYSSKRSRNRTVVKLATITGWAVTQAAD